MTPTRPCCVGPTAALGIALAVTVSAGCGRSHQEQGVDVGAIAVTTAAARLTTLRDNMNVPGIVTPVAAADFTVIAPQPAEVAELPQNEGELVKAGDIVVRLDVPAITIELTTRQLELAEATTRMERAKAETDRLKDLFDKGLAARNQWEASRTVLSATEANLSAVRGRLDAAKALEATTIIRARFAGIVARRWRQVGDMVGPGDTDPILRIVDPARLQVSAQVPILDAARIMAGQAVTVQTGLASEPAIVAVKVVSQSPTATTIDVRVNFLTPTTLPIDSVVQIDIAIEERTDVVAVPTEAIQRADGTTFVWVPDENSLATRREVRTGLIVGNLAQIVSGLKPGDLVIMTGIAQLTEGTPVTIGK